MGDSNKVDEIAQFVAERWEPVSHFGGNELGDVHRETLQELGECAAEVDTLRATIASLTIQRDAAEALAREAKRDLDAVVDVLASERDEALAILLDLVTMQDAPSDRYKIDESTKSVNVEVGDLTRLKVGQYIAIVDRARKLVGTP